MKEEQKKILNLDKYDPLSMAEKMTGNEYKDDKNTAQIGFALQMGKNKLMNELLNSVGDTHLSNKLSDYLRIVTKFGFEIIYEEQFKYEGRTEKMFVMWHYDLSILLTFDTFTWGHDEEPNVNSGHYYYNWSPNSIDTRWDLTSSGGFYSEKDAPHLALFDKNFETPYYIPNYPVVPQHDFSDMGWDEYKRIVLKPIEEQQDILWTNTLREGKRLVWCGNHDCREALVTKIKALFENGLFLKTWKDCCFPWLTNYADHYEKQQQQYPYTTLYEKTKRIISTFPDAVKKAIGEYTPIKKQSHGTKK